MTEGIKVPMTIRDFFFEDPFFKSNWEDFDKIRERMFEEPMKSWSMFENDFKNMACMSNNIMVKSAADDRQRRSVSSTSEMKAHNSLERKEVSKRRESSVSKEASINKESSKKRESSAVRKDSSDNKVFNVKIEPSENSHSGERQKTPERKVSFDKNDSIATKNLFVRDVESTDNKVYNVKIKPSDPNNSSEGQKTPERKVSFGNNEAIDTKELSKRNVVIEQKPSPKESPERKLSADKLESNTAMMRNARSSTRKESSSSFVRKASSSSQRKSSNTSLSNSTENATTLDREHRDFQVQDKENPMERFKNGWIFPRKWMLPSLSIFKDFKDMNLFQDSKDTEVIRVKNDENKMEVSLDTSQYRPDELSVSVTEGVVTIQGKHEEKAEDGSKMVSRQFVRKYTLPSGARTEDVVSNLSSDGVLVITVNKKSQQAIDVKIKQN